MSVAARVRCSLLVLASLALPAGAQPPDVPAFPAGAEAITVDVLGWTRRAARSAG